MIFLYCPVCGNKTQPFQEDDSPREMCGKCGFVHYHNSRPTVSAIIVRNGKLLLSHRAAEPFKDKWDLPGGFLEETESPEDGLKREIKEELGVGVEITKLIGVFGPTYYPFGGQDLYNTDVFYEVTVTSGEPGAIKGSDVTEIDWFLPDRLPNMAFESNIKAIHAWVKLTEAGSNLGRNLYP